MKKIGVATLLLLSSATTFAGSKDVHVNASRYDLNVPQPEPLVVGNDCNYPDDSRAGLKAVSTWPEYHIEFTLRNAKSRETVYNTVTEVTATPYGIEHVFATRVGRGDLPNKQSLSVVGTPAWGAFVVVKLDAKGQPTVAAGQVCLSDYEVETSTSGDSSIQFPEVHVVETPFRFDGQWHPLGSDGKFEAKGKLLDGD